MTIRLLIPILLVACITITADAAERDKTYLTRMRPNARLHPLILRALEADQRLDFKSALYYYRQAVNLGICVSGTRCQWHYVLTRTADMVWRGPHRSGIGHKNSETVAIALANKALAIRVDLGAVTPRLEDLAWRFYQLSALFSRKDPGPRIGMAAILAERGKLKEAQRIASTLAGPPYFYRKAIQWYNLGYLYAAMKQKKKALYYLKRALTLGCRCRQWAIKSDDYRHYRRDPDFLSLVGQFYR